MLTCSTGALQRRPRYPLHNLFRTLKQPALLLEEVSGGVMSKEAAGTWHQTSIQVLDDLADLRGVHAWPTLKLAV